MRNASESRRSFDDRCINRIDLVLLMDVIEHVEDDVGLVREYVQKVAPGTRFIATVSRVYVVVERSRRVLGARPPLYVATDRTNPSGGSLTLELGCYFYAGVLPLVALSRVAERLRRLGHEVARSQLLEFGSLPNAMFWTACRTGLPIFRANRLAGLTVFVRVVK
jgi:hypothetical protein